MKKISMCQCKRWLVWGVLLAYFGFQTSCTPENPIDRNVQVILQIPLPNPEGLKKASSITVVKSVMLKVTASNEVLITKELTISGNTASGTISIQPGNNIKFTAEAMDENNIIQWQGSATVDIVDNFKVDIELIPIPPSTSNIEAVENGKSVNLSWTKNSDPDFDRYNVYRSLSGSDIGVRLFISTVNTETVFMDNNVTEGNLYFYTLFVLDSEGFKTESKVNINPNFNPSASKLQLDTLSFNYNTKYYEARLSWTQNANSDFAKYELHRSTSKDEIGSIIYSTTVVTDGIYIDKSKLSEGDIYFYTLVVTDTKGLNSRSNVVQMGIPSIPPTPSVLLGGLDGSVYLFWTQNYNSDFARYDLYRSQSENFLGSTIHTTSFVTDTAFIDNLVSEGNNYFYTLLVVNTKGLNSRSNVVRIDKPLIPPTASSLKGTWDGSVYLTWSQNYDSDFARYELHRSTSKNEIGKVYFSTQDVAELGFVDKQIVIGETYYYTLVVLDKSGSGSESNMVPVYIPY